MRKKTKTKSNIRTEEEERKALNIPASWLTQHSIVIVISHWFDNWLLNRRCLNWDFCFGFLLKILCLGFGCVFFGLEFYRVKQLGLKLDLGIRTNPWRKIKNNVWFSLARNFMQEFTAHFRKLQ